MRFGFNEKYRETTLGCRRYRWHGRMFGCRSCQCTSWVHSGPALWNQWRALQAPVAEHQEELQKSAVQHPYLKDQYLLLHKRRMPADEPGQTDHGVLVKSWRMNDGVVCAKGALPWGSCTTHESKEHPGLCQEISSFPGECCYVSALFSWMKKSGLLRMHSNLISTENSDQIVLAWRETLQALYSSSKYDSWKLYL